jgi:hypothetical protein
MNRQIALLSLLGLNPNIINDPNVTLDALYTEYISSDEAKTIVEGHIKQLREELFNRIEKITQPDEKGSYAIKFADGTGFKKEARNSVKLNQTKALEFAQKYHHEDLISKGYKVNVTQSLNDLVEDYLTRNDNLPEGIEETLTVDESALEQAYISGTISGQELESLIDKETTYALKKLK